MRSSSLCPEFQRAKPQHDDVLERHRALRAQARHFRQRNAQQRAERKHTLYAQIVNNRAHPRRP